jgi:hypothetical protein
MFGMKRRKFITLLGVAAILVRLPLAADAQQPNKLPRLGWLGNLAATTPVYDGLRQGLRELGYVEGKNIIIEGRWAEGNLERLPELARELARLNVDVMLVGGDQGLRAAKEATATIPIIVSACDPLDSLVASVARPGGTRGMRWRIAATVLMGPSIRHRRRQPFRVFGFADCARSPAGRMGGLDRGLIPTSLGQA